MAYKLNPFAAVNKLLIVFFILNGNTIQFLNHGQSCIFEIKKNTSMPFNSGNICK